MLSRIRLCLFLLLTLLTVASPQVTFSQNQSPAQPPKPHQEVQALLDKADQAERLYHWEEALGFYAQALTKARTLQDKDGEAATLGNTGLVYLSTGQPRKALEFLQQALPLLKQVGNKEGEAAALSNLGIVYLTTGRTQQALDCYQQALPLFKQVGNLRGEAVTLTNLGLVHFSTGQSQQALDAHQQALALFRQVGDKADEANTLTYIGNVYSFIGQPKQALDAHQQALPLLKQVGDRNGEARALTGLGVVYSETGEPQQALDFFQKALPLYRQVRNRRGEADALRNIGGVYHAISQPQQALDFYQQALPLYRQVGDRRGEANTLNNMGLIYDATGQFQKALDYYQQALPLLKQVGNMAGEANTLNGIGAVYDSTGQPQQALDFYQQALPLYRQVGDRKGEARTLNSIGIVYRSTGQFQKALDYYQQARSIYRQVGAKGGEANTLTNIGNVYRFTGQPQQALDYYWQALPLHRQAGDKVNEANTLTSIGHVYLSTGHPQQALGFYQQALPLYKQGGDKAGEAHTLTDLALMETKRHQFRQAEEHLRDAVALLDRIQTELSGLSEAQIAFQAENLYVYHRSLSLMLRSNHQEALALAQKTKARALLDLMQRGKVRVRSQMTAEEQEEEQKLLFRLRTLQNTLLAPISNKAAGIKYAEAKKALPEAERAWQRLQDKLYVRHHGLKRKRAGTTLTLKDIPVFLPPETALLEYIVLRARSGKDVLDETVLFCVTLEHRKSHLTVYRLPVKSAELTEKVRDFQDACAHQNAYESKARALYKLLLAPAAKQIAGKKRLLVCPDGPLWELPFQALLTGNGKFLSEQFELSFAYSASGAQAAWQEKRSKERRHPTASLLVLADPDFGDETRFTGNLPDQPIQTASRPIDAPSRGDLFVRGGGLKRLPGTRQEAEALHHLFPDARLLLGNEAQESTVKQEAGKYRYLHFATHGLFRPSAPLLSCIALAQPPKGSEEDGFLSARELFDMDLSADLVVLSACETGRGEKKAGEGILGLTWALFAAGAPSQIVSQWSVDDASTAALMQNFYTNLKAGQKKGAALRNAMQTLRRKPQYRHPYFWAPFFLVGDWN